MPAAISIASIAKDRMLNNQEIWCASGQAEEEAGGAIGHELGQSDAEIGKHVVEERVQRDARWVYEDTRRPDVHHIS